MRDGAGFNGWRAVPTALILLLAAAFPPFALSAEGPDEKPAAQAEEPAARAEEPAARAEEPAAPAADPLPRRLVVHSLTFEVGEEKGEKGVAIAADIEAEGFKGKTLSAFVSFVTPKQQTIRASDAARKDQKDERGMLRPTLSRKIDADSVRTGSVAIFVPWRIFRLPAKTEWLSAAFSVRCGKFRAWTGGNLPISAVGGSSGSAGDADIPLPSMRIGDVLLQHDVETEHGTGTRVVVEVFPTGLEGEVLTGTLRLRRLRGGFAKPTRKAISEWNDGLNNFGALSHGKVGKKDTAGNVFTLHFPYEVVELDREVESFALEVRISCRTLNATFELETVVPRQ